jgi:predicted 3-demethylubiquinone-9 3-methyltransferase (glyoxalase superfamily)
MLGDDEEVHAQEETDRYWNAIVKNGGQESQCGWCKDRWASRGRSPRAH